MIKRKVILRRKNEDSEGDKYQYFVSCNNGIEFTTTFKEKATLLEEGQDVEVSQKDWKVLLAPKNNKK